jgi:prepilin-type N-terminal cleavage/methylation domain-containing protein
MTKKQNLRGYTIIEVLISLFIIASIVLLFVAANQAFLLNRNARYRETAVRIASSQLNVLRNTAYNSLPATGTFSHNLLSTLPQGTANQTITSFDSRTKEVRITVTWREATAAVTQKAELTSLITQGGL